MKKKINRMVDYHASQPSVIYILAALKETYDWDWYLSYPPLYLRNNRELGVFIGIDGLTVDAWMVSSYFNINKGASRGMHAQVSQFVLDLNNHSHNITKLKTIIDEALDVYHAQSNRI